MAYDIQPWKFFDGPEKRIVSVCNRKEAVRLLGVFMHDNVQQAVKELDSLKSQSPRPYILNIPNPNKPKVTTSIRLEIVKMPEDPNIANTFTLPKRYGYTGNLASMYWCIILNPDNTINVFERWNWLLGEMNKNIG